MSHYVYADCSNFCVACERLFHPSLENVPMIILSHGDERVVALSQEAKQLGIKMGDSYDHIKAFCTRKNVVAFLSNDKLYHDVSQRVMNLLSSIAEEIEFNTIDEAYLKFSGDSPSESIFAACSDICEKIKKWTGISLVMGIAPTKTLAKLASRQTKTCGVFDLSDPSSMKNVLEHTPLSHIWDIGPRLKEQLCSMGIYTAWEFRQTDPSVIRRHIGAAGLRMQRELREDLSKTTQQETLNKNLSSSKSFSRTVADSKELSETFTTFISGASAKLKELNSYGMDLHIYLESSLNDRQGSTTQYCMTVPLPSPSPDPSQMIATANQCLDKLFSPQEKYIKCGIEIRGIVPLEKQSNQLLLPAASPKKTNPIETVHAFNAFYQKNTIRYRAMGISPRSRSRKPTRSHTNAQWEGLPFALAR